MKNILLACVVIVATTVLCSGCTQKQGNAAHAPGKFELYKFFEKELRQTAKAGGYVNYKVKIDRVQQAEPLECNVPEEGAVTCYPFKIDRTEYLTGYHQTYVSKYVGDEYKIYRDREGRLKIFDHQAGQTETVERKSGGL